MDTQHRNFILTEIMYGKTPINIGGNTLFIVSPNEETILGGELVYNTVYTECIGNVGWTKEQLQDFNENKKNWSYDDENCLSGLNKDLENLKVGLYESFYNGGLSRTIRANLKTLKTKIIEMMIKKTQYDYLLGSHLADKAKLRFILNKSVYNINNKRKNVPIDIVTQKYMETKITEDQIRLIAHTEPWRSYWASFKSSGMGIFGKPAILLTENQRALISMSLFYENVRSSPECPDDEIIDDDDALEGWLILQQRRVEKDKAAKEIDSRIGNDKIRNSDEVYIKSSTDKREIERIASINSYQAQQIKKERSAILAAKHEVSEGELPDVVRKTQMALNRMVAQNAR